MKLAITGTTGFVGGHLLTAALTGGHAVGALVRRPQPGRAGVDWVEGDLTDAAALARLCAGADAVIHVAGAINAASRAAFFAANAEGTAALLRAAEAAGVPRFVQVSSLAAREPALSHYGASKAAADALVAAAPLSSATVRPAVYGPGDRESLALFRIVARGVVPAAGRGRFSIVHVADLAAALLALAAADARGTYEIADGGPAYDQPGFARAVAAAMRRPVAVLPVPAAALTLGAVLSEAAARVTGGRPRLSFDRARYIAHPDWTADPGPLIATGLWIPRTAAADGLAATADWYRAQGWL